MKRALLILLLIKVNGIFAQSVLNKYLDNYQYEKVLIVCDSIYQKSDSVSQLLEIQASALYALNRYKEAVDIYQSLAKKDSLDTSTLIRIANCYKNLNDYNKSILYFQKATTIQPENSYIRSQIGECYFKMSNYSQAKDYYFELYEIDSSYFNSKMLAQCYDQLNEIDSAIQFYNIALSSYPSDFTISYRLAVLYKDKEEFNNAEHIIKTYQIHDSLSFSNLKKRKKISFNF